MNTLCAGTFPPSGGGGACYAGGRGVSRDGERPVLNLGPSQANRNEWPPALLGYPILRTHVVLLKETSEITRDFERALNAVFLQGNENTSSPDPYHQVLDAAGA